MKKNTTYRITFHYEILTLKDLLKCVMEKNKTDFKDIEKYDEEIFDEDGDFLEIHNQVMERYISREELLVRCIFYELNAIREYYLNHLKYDYIENIVKAGSENKISYYDMINNHNKFIKILEENNYNYDTEKVSKYRDKIENLDDKNVIELCFLFGGLKNIPLKLVKDRNIKNKHFKEFINYYHIENIENWNIVEDIRKITNAFKHRKGYKDFRKDETTMIGEQYRFSINTVEEYISKMEIFFKELFKLTDIEK